MLHLRSLLYRVIWKASWSHCVPWVRHILLEGGAGGRGYQGFAVACILSQYEMSSWLVHVSKGMERHILSCTVPGA